jgi:RHS repeat-associated protein
VLHTTVYYPAGGAVRVDNTLSYVLGDQLGSSSLTLSSAGAVTAETRYYPFGETRVSTGSMPTDRLFMGQRAMADLGIYFYNARFYDPGLGRFLSADTMLPGAGNSQAYDRFAYSLGNPIKYVDPTGHVSRCSNDDGEGGGCEGIRYKPNPINHAANSQIENLTHTDHYSLEGTIGLDEIFTNLPDYNGDRPMDSSEMLESAGNPFTPLMAAYSLAESFPLGNPNNRSNLGFEFDVSYLPTGQSVIDNFVVNNFYDGARFDFIDISQGSDSHHSIAGPIEPQNIITEHGGFLFNINSSYTVNGSANVQLMMQIGYGLEADHFLLGTEIPGYHAKH